MSSVKLAGNVSQIGDGRAFHYKRVFGELNFRLPQNCQAETKPRLLPMCYYAFVLLYFLSIVAYIFPFQYIGFLGFSEWSKTNSKFAFKIPFSHKLLSISMCPPLQL